MEFFWVSQNIWWGWGRRIDTCSYVISTGTRKLKMFPWFLCHMCLRGPTWEVKGYLLDLMDSDIKYISGYSRKISSVYFFWFSENFHHCLEWYISDSAFLQTDRYLFLCHFYRYEKAQDVPLVFVSYVSTWSYTVLRLANVAHQTMVPANSLYL